MNNLRVIFLITLFICCITTVYARGNQDKEPTVERRIVQATGVVRLVGSHPMYELVITGTDGEWFIARDEMNKLHDLQHRTVTVEGEEIVRESGSSNDSPFRFNMTRRTLSNVRILTVYDGVRGFD